RRNQPAIWPRPKRRHGDPTWTRSRTDGTMRRPCHRRPPFMPTQIPTQEVLHALFHPRAVAVIGASDDTTKHGYIVLNNIRETGFPGGIYGISRRLKEVN